MPALCRRPAPAGIEAGQAKGDVMNRFVAGLALLLLVPASALAQERADAEAPVSSTDAAVAAAPTEGSEAFEGEPGAAAPAEPAVADAKTYQELIELPALRAAYELEFPVAPGVPGVAPPTILGPDNRTPVTPTTGYPARAIVLIAMSGGRCSGFLDGKHVVATAGHCVHSGGANGSWMTNVQVHPGRDGRLAPYARAMRGSSTPSPAGPATATRTTTTARSSSTATSATASAGWDSTGRPAISSARPRSSTVIRAISR